MRFHHNWILAAAVLIASPHIFAANAQPTVSISTGTATPFIGDPVTYTLSFTNPSGTITGYGPYIDLVLPTTGTDGYDGISFGSANYLGAPLVTTTIVINTAITQYHPYAKDSAGNPLPIDFSTFPGAKTGDQFVVIQLPFGGFTPTQPAAVVTVNATMDNRADVSVGMKAYARAGFQFGNDPLDNAGSGDPTLLQAAPVSATVTPTVLTAAVKNNAPESETATGPNFPRQFTVTMDIATGQKLTQVDISDVLPNNLQFVSLNSVSVAGGFGAFNQTTIANPLVTNPGVPGGTITVRLTPVSGSFTAQAGTDVTMVFTAYVPRLDASNNPVLNAATGASSTSVNTTNASILWNPIDPADPQNTFVAAAPTTDTLIDRSIAIQKSNSIPSPKSTFGPIPGDTIVYTLNVQVSDYFAYDNIVITDVLSDGQSYFIPPTAGGVAPTAQFSLHGGTSATAPMNSANFSFNRDLAVTGKSTLIMNLSAEAISRNFGTSPGKLPGGGIPDTGTGGLTPPNPNQPPLTFSSGTTAQIVYEAVIDDMFTNNFPSGEPALNANDAIRNDVVVNGRLLNVASSTLAFTANSMNDVSGSTLKIAPPKLVKTIYALNGSTSLPNPLIILPGDQLTYRLEYTLPTGDVENLKLNDFVPLPIFLVGDPLANGTNAAFIFDDVISAAPPAAGHVKFGNTETFRNLIGQAPPINQGGAPFVSINNANGNNTVSFNYGTFSNAANTQQKVDVLFTLTVTNLPFADDLFLTNQAQSSENSTQVSGTPINDDKIVQVHVGEPGLTPIYKGVVGYRSTALPLALSGLTFKDPSQAPGFASGTLTTAAQATSIGASDLISPTYPGVVDAGDIVRYAVVLQNTGHGDSYNVQLSDTYPTGMQVPAGGVNLTLIRGDGTVMVLNTDYTATTNAAGYSISLIDNYAVAPGNGAINRGQDATDTPTSDGSNTVVILFDLEVASTVTAKSTITNTATLTRYTSTPSGPNFCGSSGISDSAKVEIAPASAAKTLFATEIDNSGTTNTNGKTQAVIGEYVTYQLVVSPPEGVTTAAKIVDTLDVGLGFVDVQSVTYSSGVTSVKTIGTGASPANVTVAGQVLTFDFGDITNGDTNNAAADSITIQYRAIVLDTGTAAGNQRTKVLKNSMVFTYSYVDPVTGLTPISQAAQQVSVTVIEPTLTVANTIAKVNVPASYGASVGGLDASDTVYYSILISNNTATNDTDAYDLYFSDPFPAQLQSLSIVSVASTGTIKIGGAVASPAASDFSFTGNTLNLNSKIDLIKSGTNATITIIVSGVLSSSVEPGQVINNAATIRWSSLDGAVTARTGNAASTERSGGTQTPAANTNIAISNQNITDNYAATAANAVCNVLKPTPVKALYLTSEAHTAGSEVAIGEIVRYRLLWQMPEGTSTALKFTDNLPTGLQYLNDGTTLFAFVSTSGTLTSGTAAINTASPAIVGDQFSVPGIHPTAVLPASAISMSGANPVFSFGNMANSDTDNSFNEYVLVEFNAVVQNVTTNQAFDNSTGAAAPTSLNNTFAVSNSSNSANLTSNIITVKIAEPVIRNLTKTISGATPKDAGDAITYQLTFSNTATGADRATAFDVHLTDSVDANINVTAVTVTGKPSSTTVTNASTLGVGATVDLTFDRLDTATDLALVPDTTSVTVTITGTIIATAPAAKTISNTATLTYSSLPGGSGTTGNSTGSNTPGTSGQSTGERDGSSGAGTDATKLNNYVSTSSAVVFTLGSPAIDARYSNGLVTPANGDSSVSSTTGNSLVPGEAATLDILVTLTEGLNKNVVVNYALPSGFRFDPSFNTSGYQLFTDPATCNNQFAGTFGTALGTPTLTAPGGDGVGVSLGFGDLTLPATSGTANTSFVIRMRVIATDVTTNRIGQNLVGTATLQFTNPNTSGTTTIADSPTSNDPKFVIVEPILTVVKSVSAPAADAGDPLTYTITIGNTSGQTGYDVTLSDILPPELTSPVINSVTGAATTANFQIVTVGPNTVLQTTATTLDLASGSNIVITVSGALAGGVAPGQQINNTADVFWTSTNQTKAANPDERTGQSVPNPVSGTINNAFLDNYAISSTVATTSVSQVLVSKAIIATSEGSTANANVTIGEKITYRLTVSVPEGTINNFRIVDVIPAGQQYLAGTISLFTFCPNNIHATHPGSTNRAASTPFAGTVNAPTENGAPFGNGTTVNFDFGAITNPGNNSLEDNTFFFTYQALVLDVPGNIGFTGSQTTMTNSGSSKILPSGTSSAILVDPTNPPNTFGVTSTCVEPKMGITKDIVETVADAGDRVTVNLTVTNTGTSNAFDTIVTDQLDITQFDPASVVLTTTPASFSGSFNPVTGLIQYTGGSVPFTGAGSSVTFTFTVKLTTTVTPSQVVSNTATVTQATTLPGTDPGERSEPQVSSTDTLTIRANSISGFVFHDLNNDANFDPADTGLGSVTVKLTGTDYLSNAVSLTTTTNAGAPLGGYTFGNLRPGTYQIVVTHPAGYIDGKNKVGTPALGGTSGGFGSNTITTITIPTGATTNGINFNFGELLPSSLGGTVYDDRDASKTFNAGDAGINGVTVALTGTDDTGTSIGSVVQTTAGGGAYNFTGLRPGNYTITETQPSAFADYFDNVGSQASGTVAAPPSDAISNITLGENVTGTSNNFGERQFSTINGFVYHDANNNGAKNGGEIGLSGNTINLTGTDDLGNSVSLTINTDSTGFFSFSNLRPSDPAGYTLTEPINPPGYSSGINTVGTQGGTTFSVPNDHINLVLPSGVTAANYLFGKHFITCDLSLTKTVDLPNPNINDVITYTITVLNSGPDTATNVAVTDILPAGLGFVSATPSQGSYSNATGIWTIGTILNGASKTLQIKATVLTVSAVTNTAEVTACDQPDPDSTPNNHVPGEDDQASVTIANQIVDLSLTKTVDITNPNINDVITYTVQIANAGPNTATNVAVTDLLPAGVSFVSSTPSQGAYVSATGIWSVGTLTSNGNATLAIKASVTTVNSVTNTAEVTTCDQPDIDSTPNNHLPSEDDQASATIAGQVVDLSLTKVIDNATPNINDVVTYTIQVANAGPNTATHVVVTDLLPAGLNFVASTPSQGGYVSGTGIWSVGTLTSNSNATLQIKASVTTVNSVTNTAEVTACDQPDIDSTPNNHVPTEDDQASVPIVAQKVNLAVTKVVDNAHPSRVDLATFTIKVVNQGPNTATKVVFTDLLPVGLEFVGATPSQGTYDATSGAWSIGTLLKDGSATLTVGTHLVVTNSLTNVVTYTSSEQPDTNPDDNTASATVTPQLADLSLVKTIENNKVDFGGIATYTITLANAGPDIATHVAVSDQLPAGLEYVSSSATQGSFDGATGIWTVGTVKVGEVKVLTLLTKVVQEGEILNMAQVSSSDQMDPNSTPNDNILTQNDLSMVSLIGGSDLKVNAVQCFAARFNFRKANADRLVFLTTLALPAGFKPAGLPTQFKLNGYIFNCTLDANGRYRSKTAYAEVRPSGKNWRVQLSIRNQDLQHSMAGVVNADMQPTALAPAQISVKLGDSTYGVKSPQTYKAKKDVAGALYH